MVTYSVPFFRREAGQRELAGVVTADLALNWVKTTAAAVEMRPAGVAWIFSPPGQLPFVAPIGSTAKREPKPVELPTESFIREQGERLYARGIRVALVDDTGSGEPVYLIVRNLETLDWRLVLAIPRAELLADARALLRRQMLLGAAGLAGLFAAIFLVAAGISRPIRALARSVGGVRIEEFDFQLPTESREDEIGVLTDALRRMRDALQRHIQMRAESLAGEKKREHELAFAATIQQSMLPTHDSVALPGWAQVCAELVPAKRVGGDLFDYFAVRDGALLFTVGDVSDKGIPAALCMARLSSLLRLLGTAGEAPNQVLRDVNTRFNERNEACMFATLGCGMLDGNTGRLRYASAGHEPPLLREAGGRILQLDVENGAAIGVEAHTDYPLTERYLAPGDTLIMFTDGVTEAVADDGSLFGVERLRELLGDASGSRGSTELVRHIIDSVTVRTAHFHATDDLTVLTVTFAPQAVTASRTDAGTSWLVETAATVHGIRQARQYLQTILASRGISAAQIGDAELIAEELLTNVVKAAEAAAVAIRLSLACELTFHEIVLTIRDDGPPFDPLAGAGPDLDAVIADRLIGGLGIHIVRELAAACRYERSSDANILEIRLRRSD
jgi:sigma-B regulation protein RsbU (phosphoserine phosphatase)